MTRARRLVGSVSLLLAISCQEKREERMAASYSSVTKPSDSAPLAAPRPGPRPPEKVVVGIDSIPTEESYEERAESTISEANLPAKVAELEKELGP